MEVEIGGNPKDQLVSSLESKGFFANYLVDEMVKQDAFVVLGTKKSLKLARCPIRDLGFTEMPTTAQLQQRVVELGHLCPAELGLHLRQQLKDQPKGDIFQLVMEQVMDFDGNLNVFELFRHGDGGTQWLGTREAEPDDEWSLECEVVFVLAN